MNIDLVFLIVALICFIAAAIGWPSTRVNLVAAGLAFWVATLLF